MASVKIAQRTVRAERDRNACSDRVRCALPSDLSPIRRMVAAVGPINARPACVIRFGKIRILGQEAEARMNGLTAGSQRRRNDIIHIQVAVRRTGRTDADRFVRDSARSFGGQPRSKTATEIMPKSRQARNNADRNLAAVRNEYLLETSRLALPAQSLMTMHLISASAAFLVTDSRQCPSATAIGPRRLVKVTSRRRVSPGFAIARISPCQCRCRPPSCP